MEKVSENKYAKMQFNSKNSYVILSWDEVDKDFRKEGFLEEIKMITGKIRDLNTDKFLLDLSGMDDFFPVEIQNIDYKEIGENFKNISLSKLAIILPENIFSRILLEASYFSLFERKKVIGYFNELEDAKKWLITSS